jgi:thiol-disulfide isomerase/thioredoxin
MASIDIMHRRGFVAGIAASMAAPGITFAKPQAEAKLFTDGMLAGNRVAATFRLAPGDLSAPGTMLAGSDGHHRLGDLKGKVRLVTLWAEWCPPCIIAMPDLAQLQKRYGGTHFEILAVLTGSRKKLSLADARNEMIKIGADALPVWVEPGGGKSVLNALAQQNGKAALPCDLIVDAAGRIRGRSFGTTMTGFDVNLVPEDLANGQLTESGKAKVAAAQAKVTAQRSSWSSPEGDAFINALANGALD